MSHIVLWVEGTIVYDSGVVTPVPTPNPTPLPPPSGDNPFIAWKEVDGLSLNDVHDYKLHGGLPRKLTEAQWMQALAAGYHRSDLSESSDPSGPSGFPSGFDLTGTERGTGRRNYLLPGQVYTFTWTAPRSGPADWQFEVNPGVTTAKNVWFNGVRFEPSIPEWTRLDFMASAGVSHTLSIQLDGTATVGLIVRYA